MGMLFKRLISSQIIINCRSLHDLSHVRPQTGAVNNCMKTSPFRNRIVSNVLYPTSEQNLVTSFETDFESIPFPPSYPGNLALCQYPLC